MGKRTSFDDLIKASEPASEVVKVDDFEVTVRELTGAERFEFGLEHAEANKWETYRWLAFKGMVDPAPETEDELDSIKPEWVLAISAAVMRLSGILESSEEDAEKKSEATTDTGSGLRAMSVAQ